MDYTIKDLITHIQVNGLPTTREEAMDLMAHLGAPHIPLEITRKLGQIILSEQETNIQKLLIDAFEESVDLDSDNLRENHYRKGIISQVRGQHVAAIENFRAAKRENEEDVFLISRIVHSISTIGDSPEFTIEKKRELFEEAFELINQYPQIHVGNYTRFLTKYVNFYLEYQGSSPRLEELLERNVFQLNEKNVEQEMVFIAQLALLKYYVKTHQFSKAIAFGTEIGEGSASEFYNLLMTKAFWGLGDFSMATKYCDIAINAAKNRQNRGLQEYFKKLLQLISMERPYPEEKAPEYDATAT